MSLKLLKFSQKFAPINQIQFRRRQIRHNVTMLPGGKIGLELMGYVREVFKYAGIPVDFEIVGIDPASEGNDDLEYAIKGYIETKREDLGVVSRNVAIRNELDIFVYVVNCKSYPGIQGRHKYVDIAVLRQNSEGEYAMLEHESVRGIVESMKIITREYSDACT